MPKPIWQHLKTLDDDFSKWKNLLVMVNSTQQSKFPQPTATSSQMINFSPLMFDQGNQKVGDNMSSYRKVGGQSRTGFNPRVESTLWVAGALAMCSTPLVRAVFAGAAPTLA